MQTNEILSAITSTSKNITKIQNRFYEVVKVPMHPKQIGGVLLKNPTNMYGVYNAKTGELLSEKSQV